MNIAKLLDALPPQIITIAQHIADEGGQCILVGGAVRDFFLDLPLKDIDIEVFSISSYEELQQILSKFGKTVEVGKSFGVLKMTIDELEIDFSFPRRETKIGAGHKGFHIESNSSLTFEQAASRRDFTINAMGIDLINQTFLDPFSGLADLKKKCLRHVGPAFIEDPLRVHRGIQFVARFQLTMAPETLELCQSIRDSLSELPKERLFEEFKKLLLKSPQPSIGFNLMRKLAILPPELHKLINTPQDPEWHPEGDVWVHTLQVVDQMAQLRPQDDKRALILMFAAVCHDLGKPQTTQKIDGRWRSPGHEPLGEKPTRSFLNRLTDEKDLIEPVVALVKEHLKPALLYKSSQLDGVSDGAIRRLSLRVNIPDLLLLGKADHFGCDTKEGKNKSYPAGEWLNKRFKELQLDKSPPKPILLGRHLIKRGVQPGVQMGQLLQSAFEAQLDGQFADLEGALNWLESYH